MNQSGRPKLNLDGVTPKQARRIADIADALAAGGLPVAEITAPIPDWVKQPDVADVCGGCGEDLEYGHCYRCSPVWGYGEGFLS